MPEGRDSPLAAMVAGPKPRYTRRRVDFEDFRRRVRRDDYQRHKYWFLGFAAGILGVLAFETAYFALLSGVSLIGSGVAAIRGGKSAVTGIGVSGPGGSAQIDWSERELENMSPQARADHANLTGGFLIVMGASVLALIAYFCWIQFREDWAARQYQAMADSAGLVSKAAPEGRGLAASAREVCWSDDRTVTLCSEPDLAGIPRIRTDYYASELVYTPRGLVLAGDLDVTWVATFSNRAVFASAPKRLFNSGAKALTALGSRVAWVSDSQVLVADLASERPLASPQRVAEVWNAERPLLALAHDAILYGPTENCALAWQGAEACAVPAELRPCAVGSNQKYMVLMTNQGELWRATARAQFSRVASGLRGCLLAANDRFAFVAGEGPIARVDLRTGSQVTIFQDAPASAIALTDRMLYFRSAGKVQGVRLDAPPL